MSFLAIYHLWQYWQEIIASGNVKVGHSSLVSDNLTNSHL